MQKSSSSLYSNFILNLYIVYEFNKLPVNLFPQKNGFFGTVKLVRNWISKSTYNVQGIAFDGESSWGFLMTLLKML